MAKTKLAKDMIIKRRTVWNCRFLINRALTVDELMVFIPKNQVAIDELRLLWNMGWIHYDDNQKIRLTPLGLVGLRQSFPSFKYLPQTIPLHSVLDTFRKRR